MEVVSLVVKVLLAEVTHPKPEITSLTSTRTIITQKNPLLVPYISMKIISYTEKNEQLLIIYFLWWENTSIEFRMG